MTASVLQTEASSLAFRPLARTDYALLRHWLRTPHVARWWADDSSDEGLEEMYGGCIDGTEPSRSVHRGARQVALSGSRSISHRPYSAYRNEIAALTEVPAGASSIDYLIGPEDAIRRGWGTDLHPHIHCAAMARRPRRRVDHGAGMLRIARPGVCWNAPAFTAWLPAT